MDLEIIRKASKILNFLKQTLYQCESIVKVSAYLTLVRLILEYVKVVWNPHHQYLIDNIEMVQQHPARWVKQDYRQTSSVTETLNELQWTFLCQCRRCSRLPIFIKLLYQDPPGVNIPDHYLPTL